jgi:hypothetical protein
MTLTMTVATTRWIHQSADVRLSDPRTRNWEDSAVGKLTFWKSSNLLASIAYSELALHNTFVTAEWLNKLLVDRGTPDPSFDDLIEVICSAGTTALKHVPTESRETNFSVAAVENQVIRLGIVSNRTHISGAQAPRAAPAMWAEAAHLGSRLKGSETSIRRLDGRLACAPY